MKMFKIFGSLLIVIVVAVCGLAKPAYADVAESDVEVGIGTDSGNAYSLTAGTFANNQRGSMYSHIDGVGVHILHSWEAAPISRFVGVKLNGVKNTTIADADLIVFQIDVTASEVKSLRVQFGTSAVQKKGFVMDSPDGTFTATTAAATSVTKATKFLAFPATAASLSEFDYVKIFENINTIGAWSKFTIGDVYAAKKNGEGNGLAAYEKIWSVDFETANYEAYYVDYTTGDDAEADATKIFDVRALHAGEFWVSPGALELTNPEGASINGANLLNYNIPDAGIEALKTDDGKYDLDRVKGLEITVKNTSDADTKFFVVFNGAVSASGKKCIFIPKDGEAYWGATGLEAGFEGKIIIPYDARYLNLQTGGSIGGIRDSILTYAQIYLLPSQAVFSGASFIVKDYKLLLDLTAYDTQDFIDLNVGQNGTASAICNDVIGIPGAEVKIVLEPDENYLVSEVVWNNTNYDVTDNICIISGYDGSRIDVSFRAVTMRVTYDGLNGADLSVRYKDMAYNTKTTLDVPVMEGYIFDGWYTKPNGGGEAYTDSQGNMLNGISASLTVYPKWTMKTSFVVTLDAGDGTADYLSVDVEYGKPFELGVATLEGYDFTGWYDENDVRITDENGVSISDYSLKSDCVLYAKFAKNTASRGCNSSTAALNICILSAFFGAAMIKLKK